MNTKIMTFLVIMLSGSSVFAGIGLLGMDIQYPAGGPAKSTEVPLVPSPSSSPSARRRIIKELARGVPDSEEDARERELTESAFGAPVSLDLIRVEVGYEN